MKRLGPIIALEFFAGTLGGMVGPGIICLALISTCPITLSGTLSALVTALIPAVILGGVPATLFGLASRKIGVETLDDWGLLDLVGYVALGAVVCVLALVSILAIWPPEL